MTRPFWLIALAGLILGILSCSKPAADLETPEAARENLALDVRPILADLPPERVRDRLLIDIHNITLEALDKMSKQRKAKYSIPGDFQRKNPAFSGTNNVPQVK